MNGPARVVLASRNAGKLNEVRRIMAPEVDVIGLTECGPLQLPPEDGATYEENALAKARAVAAATGLPALADDSGLEVDALGGRPGVRSSRYAGPACDAAANNALLLRELADVPEGKRGAVFVCVAVLVTPAGEERLARGDVRGRIMTDIRGRAGFGYDPLFMPEGFDKTFAEMDAEEKNALSHRGRAFREIARDVAEL